MTRHTWGLIAARLGLVVWLALVVWSSLAPVSDLPVSPSVSDKLLHMVGYGVLGALGILAFRRPRPVLVLLGIVGFGLVLEVLQRRTGYRSFEWGDLLADAVGAAIGITAALIFRDVVSRRVRAEDAH